MATVQEKIELLHEKLAARFAATSPDGEAFLAGFARAREA